MTPKSRLIVLSIFFAVAWTLLMLWWSGSFEAANIVILTISGAIAGVLWYLGMRRFGPPHMRG